MEWLAGGLIVLGMAVYIYWTISVDERIRKLQNDLHKLNIAYQNHFHRGN